MTLGAQIYIFGNNGRALRLEYFFRSKNALVIIKRFLGDLRGPWELSGLGGGAWGGLEI